MCQHARTVLGVGAKVGGRHDGEHLDGVDERRQRRVGRGVDGDGVLRGARQGIHVEDGIATEVVWRDTAGVKQLAIDVNVELAHGVIGEELKLGEVHDDDVAWRRVLGLRPAAPGELDILGAITRRDRRLHHLGWRLEEIVVYI